MQFKVKHKDEEEHTEPSIDNKLELTKYTVQVQSRIHKDITSDFILAKLSEKDKEGCINLTADAFFAQKLINLAGMKAKRWTWNDESKKWELINIQKDAKDKIEKLGQAIFDTYMIKVTMTTLLNRNVEKNHLIRLLAGQPDDIKEYEPEKDIEGIVDRIKEASKIERDERERVRE